MKKRLRSRYEITEELLNNSTITKKEVLERIKHDLAQSIAKNIVEEFDMIEIDDRVSFKTNKTYEMDLIISSYKDFIKEQKNRDKKLTEIKNNIKHLLEDE